MMSQSLFADTPASEHIVSRAVAALVRPGKLSAVHQAALVTTLESGSTLAAVTDELGFRSPEECRDAIFDRCVEDWVGGAITNHDLTLHLEVICERSPVAMVQFKELSFKHIMRTLHDREQAGAQAFANDIDLAFEDDGPAQRRISALLELEHKTEWQQALTALFAEELEILHEKASRPIPEPDVEQVHRAVPAAGGAVSGPVKRVRDGLNAALHGAVTWLFPVDEVVETIAARRRRDLAIAADSQLAIPEPKEGVSLAWDLSGERPTLTITSLRSASGRLTLLDRRRRPGAPTHFELSEGPDGIWMYSLVLDPGALDAFAHGQIEVIVDD